jgi:hypothetical protein
MSKQKLGNGLHIKEDKMENITPFEVYVILTMDSVVGLLWFLTSSSLILAVVAAIVYAMAVEDNEDEFASNIRKFAKPLIAVFSISALLLTFIPATKSMLLILGVPAVANNEDIRNISSNGLKLIDEYISDELEVRTKEVVK